MTTTTDTRTLDELCVNTIRTLSMDAVEKANSGHPGTPMALAPLAYVLYTRVMRHNPSNADWPGRDRFILSAGHASMLLYSSLYLAGYPMTLDDLKHFRQVGSPTAGHPERKYSPGIEATTGPLGQGISMAAGMALGERMLAARFNTDEHEIVDNHTFVVASDGDIQEGVQAEAASLAGHLGLGRLIVYYDDNKIQLASEVDKVMSEDVGKRYEAYGWHVTNIGEDLELDNLERVTREAMDVEDRPSLVILRSHIGYGSPKQDTTSAHGSPLGEEAVRETKEKYGWDPDEDFYVPDEVLEHFRECCCERGKQLEEEWNEKYEAWKQANPERVELFESLETGAMPDGWDSDPPKFDADEKGMATRKASGEAIQWAAKKLPNLVGGSADLASSNNTDIEDGGDVQKGHYEGRNIRFGVREHGMGAMVNGLGLEGLRAFGGTFLTFSDYMRGAIRISALMKLPSIWVYTHDSIGLGEDGPTHQSIEHLPALRAIPRLNVVRPADANEAVLGWKFALNTTDAPTAFALSRQNVPTLDPSWIPDDAIERGAYVLRDFGDGDTPDVILIGTGSEVGLCLEAAEKLDADGVAVRVVSMPCMDTFTHADESYREEVLPAACRARVAVEAASPLGWDKWIGEEGCFLGMETFGESGPAKDVYEHFGITADHLVELARKTREQVGATT